LLLLEFSITIKEFGVTSSAYNILLADRGYLSIWLKNESQESLAKCRALLKETGPAYGTDVPMHQVLFKRLLRALTDILALMDIELQQMYFETVVELTMELYLRYYPEIELTEFENERVPLSYLGLRCFRQLHESRPV
jgi:hypothetical protein